MKDFKTIVTEHFKIPASDVTDALTAKDIPAWDSMNYLLFIAELEKEYGVSFTMDEVLTADSLGTIRSLLRSKGAPV